LENDVLRTLWAAETPLRPSEINERLDAGHAYTSIATVLSRLHRKGLVKRTPVGRAFAYSPALDESALAARRITDVLDSSSDRSKVLSRFIGGLSSRDAKAVRAMLDQLQSHRGDV